jgi:hypothetical protein
LQNFSFDLTEEVTSVAFDPDKWILRHQQYKPDLPVRINQSDSENPVSIYPNPFSDYIYLDIAGISGNNNLHYVIYNAYGQLVKQESISSNRRVQISTSDLVNGIYFLELIHNGDRKSWKKLIKY